MNLLQMAQALYGESGAAGSYPTTVVGATGQWLRLVNWLIASDLHIQNKWVNWKFLRSTYNFTTTPTLNTDPGPTNPTVGEWDFDAWYVTYPNDTVPSPIIATEFEMIKHDPVDPNDTGPPWRIVVMPDNTLRIDSIPDNSYPVQGDYYQTPVQMPAVDASTSIIPARFHWTIIARALILYGKYENADSIIAQGNDLYTDYLAQLETSQLPNAQNARGRSNSHFAVGDTGDGGGHYERRGRW